MKKVVFLALAVIAVLAACHYIFGLFWFAKAPKRLALLSSESEPADQGAISINGHPPPPPKIRGYIENGERVFIAFDMYGKDYWTCFAVTKKARHGWVLCTDLERRGS